MFLFRLAIVWWSHIRVCVYVYVCVCVCLCIYLYIYTILILSSFSFKRLLVIYSWISARQCSKFSNKEEISAYSQDQELHAVVCHQQTGDILLHTTVLNTLWIMPDQELDFVEPQIAKTKRHLLTVFGYVILSMK